MQLIQPRRTTTIVETASQCAILRLPECKYARYVTLRVTRTTEIGNRYGDCIYTATLSIACSLESAEIDAQNITGCVPCEHLFGLFGGTNPDDCAQLRMNAIRNAIRNASRFDGDEPFPVQHRERLLDLLPALSD
jgi:hypothetical protein